MKKCRAADRRPGNGHHRKCKGLGVNIGKCDCVAKMRKDKKGKGVMF